MRVGHTGFFPGGGEHFSEAKTPTFSFHDVVRGRGSHRFLSQGGSTFPRHCDPPPLTMSWKLRCVQTDRQTDRQTDCLSRARATKNGVRQQVRVCDGWGSRLSGRDFAARKEQRSFASDLLNQSPNATPNT